MSSRCMPGLGEGSSVWDLRLAIHGQMRVLYEISVKGTVDGNLASPDGEVECLL